MSRGKSLGIGLLLIGTSIAPGQTPGPGGPPQFPRFVLYEAVAFPATDSTLVRIDVHYRIEKDFFVSLREVTPGQLGKFQRRGEILVELIDAAGLARERTLNRVELSEDEEPGPATGDKEWIQGMMSFRVPAGPYKVAFEASDLQSQQRFADRTRTVDAALPQHDSLATSTPLLVSPPDSPAQPKELHPVNYGGDILFGAPASLYLELSPLQTPDSTAEVSYHLNILEREGGKEPADSSTNISPRLLRNIRLEPATDSGNDISYTILDTLSSSGGIIIPLPARQMLLRLYELKLKIRIGSRTATITKPVRVVWPDMPMSLRDVDYALFALRYIAPARVIDSLLSGSFETRRNNLEGFWRAKSRTPEIAYNDLMTQYYRRVDYASRTFGTLKQPDGMRSDRGKIYILYGPPTNIERVLDPSAGFKETWTYEKLKRSFVFVDRAKNGIYVLVTGSES
jgi:GWxTD domain-containing protein